MVSSYMEEGEKDRKDKEKRDSSKTGTIGKNEKVKAGIEM